MKRLMLFALLSAIILAGPASAECALSANLVNQEPHPAIPGEYVKLLFQVSGLEHSKCSDVTFELLERYPVSFDPGYESVITTKAGTFTENFDARFTVPYEVRVDASAIDGEAPLKVRYKSVNAKTYVSNEFNLSVKDVRTDFEIFVRNYDFAEETLTLEILNTGKNDVEALTIEMPEQENVAVHGATTKIVGSLDSNDFTTADFKAVPSRGDVRLKIRYTDEINARRDVEKLIKFEPKHFERSKDKNEDGNPVLVWAVPAAVVLIAIVLYRRHRKRKRKKLLE